MLSGKAIQNRWSKRGLIFALWTLIGLAFSSQFYLTSANSLSPVTWKFALEHSLADWYLFALLSIPALWLARRFHFDRFQWPGQMTVHLLAGAAFSVLWMLGRALIEEWLSQARESQVT